MEYEDLQKAYAGALKIYTAGAGGNFKEADSSVLGKDRPPTDLLDKIAEASIERTHQVLEMARKQALIKGTIIGLSLLLVSIIGVIVVMLISRSIVLSIKKLEQAATEISKGNLGIEVINKSKDEIGYLADTFNQMTKNLKALVQKEKEFVLAEATVASEKQKADELRAINQRLTASEQSLKAMNQQLSAKEQQLLADEQDLRTAKTGLEEKVKERTKALEEAKASLEVRVQERTIELQEKMAELEKMNKFMTDREMRVIEIKKEVNKLCRELGKPERYGVG